VAAARTPAQVYEDFFVPALFVPCAAELLELVPPDEGDRVLDVACGSGAVARAAAARVGPRGSVTGVDLRPGMIEVAASLPPVSGPPVDWRVGDALALEDGDGSYDVVLCQQGIQFFPDQAGAVREMRRVLARGGRVGLAVWQGMDRNDFFRELTEVEARHLEALGVTYEELAGPFLHGDPEWLHALLADSGFGDVRVEERTFEARFAADGFVENVEFAYSAVVPEFSDDPERFAAFVEAVDRDARETLERHRDGAEIAFDVAVNVGAGVA
jgi:SAM-dependent methyltransferase